MESRPWHVLDLSYDARMKIVEAYADRRLADAAASRCGVTIGREVEIELLDTTVEVARMLAGPDAAAAVADDGDVYKLLAGRFRVTRFAPWWPTYRDVVAQLRKEVAEVLANLSTVFPDGALSPKTTLSSIAFDLPPGVSAVAAETFAIACDRGLPLHAEACLPFVDVNAVCTFPKHGTGLLNACRGGHTHVVARLLATKDINVNTVVQPGTANRIVGGVGVMGTALLQATLHGHLEIVRLLLNAPGIDVNGTGVPPCTDTPLSVAASEQHLAIMNALLDAPGINVNWQDEDGFTPLHLACEVGATDIVERLVAVDGIDVNMATATGMRPLTMACDADVDDLSGDALVRFLLRAPGIDVNRPPEYGFGRSPLLYACYKGCSPAVVRALLDAPGVDTRWTDAEGNTALMIAVEQKRKRLLPVLMIYADRIDINAVNSNGETALDFARCSDDPGILPQLCKIAEVRDVQLRGKGGEVDVAGEVGSLDHVSPYGT